MVDFNQPYKQRTAKESNVAETKCVEYLNDQDNLYWYKFGFDETHKNIPFKYFIKIPEKLRCMPDYVCIGNYAFFLECKGYKGYLKLKEEDLANYEYWNSIMKLWFFAYDCVKHKHHFKSFLQIKDKIPLSEIDTYPDNNKTYYKIRL